MYNLNYQEEARAFKESINDLKKVLTQKNNKIRNSSTSQIDKNKSSLI